VESIEASGRSIEDAILQALVRLGRRRDEVDVVVLQEPARGRRGVGGREARVRVSLKAPRRSSGAVVTPEMADAVLGPEETYAPEDDAEAYAEEEPYAEDEEEYAEGEYPEGEYPEEEYVEEGTYGADAGPDAMSAAPPVAALRAILGPDATIEQVAIEALRAILAHMGLGDTLIEVRSQEPLTLNVRSASGADLSVLIGRRGETLSSLQLLVALIVARQTGQRERVIVDAEGYRQRREENLTSLAHRVAQQVRRSQSPVTLEAMPPNERRIIHMALAEDEDLTTESTGEGEQRRVVIALKRSQPQAR
jgi:spoIIIJ-associated protein